MGVICVLPARISSTRISRKPLQPLAGRTLLEWCWRAASAIRAFDSVVIATDSEEIESCARGFDAEVVRTRSDHPSGTDRVNEAADLLGAEEDDVVVNFQADEPFVDGGAIEGAVRRAREVATIAAPIRAEEEWRSPAVVKVARAADGRRLLQPQPHPFSRDKSPAPGARLRHIGVYACRRPRQGVGRPAGIRAGAGERLEQLRASRRAFRSTSNSVPGPTRSPMCRRHRRAERVLSSKEVGMNGTGHRRSTSSYGGVVSRWGRVTAASTEPARRTRPARDVQKFDRI